MHIGIDCRFASGSTGLGSFVRGIVKGVLEVAPEHQYTLFVSRFDQSWLRDICDLPNVRCVLTPFPHYSFREQFFFPLVLWRSAINFLYVPHFNAPLFSPVPFIITVHDLILHRYATGTSFFKRLVYRVIFYLALWRASSILAISQATQKELLAHYPSVRQKVFVSYPGIDPMYTRPLANAVQDILSAYSLHRPYFLYVGSAKKHKNVPFLIQAFLTAKCKDCDLVLVCNDFPEDVIHGPSVRILRNVPREDMPALYSGARAKVTATLAEGFCLPVIEAMAMGCMVLATNVGPLPEVTGGLAMLVEPTQDAFVQAFQKLSIDSSFLTPDKRMERTKWALGYQWTTSARQLISTVLST